MCAVVATRKVYLLGTRDVIRNSALLAWLDFSKLWAQYQNFGCPVALYSALTGIHIQQTWTELNREGEGKSWHKTHNVEFNWIQFDLYQITPNHNNSPRHNNEIRPCNITEKPKQSGNYLWPTTGRKNPPFKREKSPPTTSGRGSHLLHTVGVRTWIHLVLHFKSEMSRSQCFRLLITFLYRDRYTMKTSLHVSAVFAHWAIVTFLSFTSLDRHNNICLSKCCGNPVSRQNF